MREHVVVLDFAGHEAAVPKAPVAERLEERRAETTVAGIGLQRDPDEVALTGAAELADADPLPRLHDDPALCARAGRRETVHERAEDVGRLRV